jgi:L-glyceraldehyde 3-phosphate reductase
MFQREPEREDVFAAAAHEGMGVIVFSPLAQGLLTDRYLRGIPRDSRAAGGGFLKAEQITPERRSAIAALDGIARSRSQSLAQMALQWVLRDGRVTSALMGVSRVAQLEDAAKALDGPPFSAQELAAIDQASA